MSSPIDKKRLDALRAVLTEHLRRDYFRLPTERLYELFATVIEMHGAGRDATEPPGTKPPIGQLEELGLHLCQRFGSILSADYADLDVGGLSGLLAELAQEMDLYRRAAGSYLAQSADRPDVEDEPGQFDRSDASGSHTSWRQLDRYGYAVEWDHTEQRAQLAFQSDEDLASFLIDVTTDGKLDLPLNPAPFEHTAVMVSLAVHGCEAIAMLAGSALRVRGETTTLTFGTFPEHVRKRVAEEQERRAGADSTHTIKTRARSATGHPEVRPPEASGPVAPTMPRRRLIQSASGASKPVAPSAATDANAAATGADAATDADAAATDATAASGGSDATQEPASSEAARADAASDSSDAHPTAPSEDTDAPPVAEESGDFDRARSSLRESSGSGGFEAEESTVSARRRRAAARARLKGGGDADDELRRFASRTGRGRAARARARGETGDASMATEAVSSGSSPAARSSESAGATTATTESAPHRAASGSGSGAFSATRAAASGSSERAPHTGASPRAEDTGAASTARPATATTGTPPPTPQPARAAPASGNWQRSQSGTWSQVAPAAGSGGPGGAPQHPSGDHPPVSGGQPPQSGSYPQQSGGYPQQTGGYPQQSGSHAQSGDHAHYSGSHPFSGSYSGAGSGEAGAYRDEPFERVPTTVGTLISRAEGESVRGGSAALLLRCGARHPATVVGIHDEDGRHWTVFIREEQLLEVRVEPDDPAFDIGHLIAESGLVEPRALEDALAQTAATGMPVVDILTRSRALRYRQMDAIMGARSQLLLKTLFDTKIKHHYVEAYDNVAPGGGNPQPFAPLAWQRLLAICQAKSQEELDSVLKEHQSDKPSFVDGALSPASLRLKKREFRFVESSMTGSITVTQALARSPLRRRPSLALVAALEFGGLLNWQRMDAKAQRVARVWAQVVQKNSELKATNPFDLLEAHWSSDDVLILESYRKVVRVLDLDYIEENGTPAQIELAQKVKSGLMLARDRLQDRGDRKKIRDEVIDDFGVRSAIQLYEKQSELAIFKGDQDRAADALRRIVELNPRDQKAKDRLRSVSRTG